MTEEKVYDIHDLTGKTITGIGHKPWHHGDEAEPVLIANGKCIRVTFEAHQLVKFDRWNQHDYPKKWDGKHCIWALQPALYEEWCFEPEPLFSSNKPYNEQVDFYHGLYKDYPGMAWCNIVVWRRELDKAVAYAKECWPDAVVEGIVTDHNYNEDKSLVQVVFNQTTNND